MTREKIIQEIKSAARENGGRAPGRRRFLTETGIRDSDWQGRYWVRWNDALKEAGFAPNNFQAGYSVDLLIENYIALVRELGHLPVNAELRLKRQSDLSFPNDKAFRRFGSKADLICKVLRYCGERSGFDDIVQLCREAAPSSDDSVVRKEPESPRLDSDGYVYLAKSGKYYKIGRSNSVGRREYELTIQLPERLKPIHSIRTDDPAGIEAYWHNRFKEKRLNGEWFKLDGTDVQAFRRRKFM